jgi:HlyD family secretion protein
MPQPEAPPKPRPAYLSPDQLNQLFVVVRPRGWLALMGLAVVAVAGLGWGLFARIPEAVNGPGVLLVPGGVRSVQARGGGQVVEVRVRPGQVVKAGDVLAVLNIPDAQAELTRAKARLEELDTTDKGQIALETLRLEQEEAYRVAQDKLYAETLTEAQATLKVATEDFAKLTKTSKEQVDAARTEVETARGALLVRIAEAKKLVEQKLESKDRLNAMEASLTESALNLANLLARAAESGFRELDFRQTIATQKQRIGELTLQRQQLGVRKTQLDQEIAQAKTARAAMRAEQFERVKRVETQLREDGVVTSPHAGRIVEVSALAGQLVQPGGRIAALEVSDDSSQLTHLAYFPVAGGKRIEKGMEVQVTPTTVRRERYGGIVGKVVRVSAFPISAEAVGSIVGSSEVVRELAPPGGMIEVEIELERADTPSKFRWTSVGPTVQLTPGTTTHTRVVVGKRAPLSYLIPGLRTLLGEADDP